jgi:hypothetical protein
VETITCPQCGGGHVKRIKVAVGYVLIIFGLLLLSYLMSSNLPLNSPRGLGNIAVGAVSIAYGCLVLWRRKYKCDDCSEKFRIR